MRALNDLGIRPTIISGASTGSLVAAAYASEQLDQLEDWVCKLTKIDVWRLLDARFSGGGIIRGSRVMQAVAEQLRDSPIESLGRKFGAVAVDLYSGEEVWLQKGSMLTAVRASSGLPGLLTPILHDGRWLIDGGVLNPVPVSLCRAMGADYVIAVSLNLPLAERSARKPSTARQTDVRPGQSSEEDTELFARWSGLLEDFVSSIRSGREPTEPSLVEVLYTTLNIMQDRISRSRMEGDPADLVVRPRLRDFHLMDFHRAAEAIEVGRAAVAEIAPSLPVGP